jgi:glycosyltransferase involved in cell wall biosynthesis
MSDGDPRVSVVIPLYNEAALVESLLRRVRGVLDGLPGGPHEVVTVDDGSVDETAELLVANARGDTPLVVVKFSRNFGHQAAITAGLKHATGDVVVVMDGDLQDEPEWIPEMLDRFREGYDVVYAERRSRTGPRWLRLCYWTYYRLLAAVSDHTIPLDAGDFSLMSRRVVQELNALRERHRYLRGLRAWAGFEQTAIQVDRGPRAGGSPKYNLRRLLRLGLDGVFSFTIVPLRMASVLGFLTILATATFALYALYAKLVLDRSPQGFTALILTITFVSGVNLLFLGVVGEYVGRIYEQSKSRPLYVIDSIHSGDSEGSGDG